LKALRAEGWDIDIQAHRRQGGRVLGLCAGYQMLGASVADPQGIEGKPETVPGLGLLDVATVLTGEKALTLVEGSDHATGTALRGYEMHVGVTTGGDTQRPMLTLGGDRPDGAQSRDGRVQGCYVHGLFASDQFRAAYLADLHQGRATSAVRYDDQVDATLDALADHLERVVNLERVLAIARSGQGD